MNITLSFRLDEDAPSCNWHEIAQIVRNWSTRHTEKKTSLFFTPTKGSAEISLNFTGADLILSIGELHGKLYDHQVNFTVLVAE